VAAAGMVAVAIMVGCAGPRLGAKRQRLLPSPHPVVADIPVPTGFEIVDQASEDRPGDRQRYLRHRYRGKADKGIVKTFYQEEMPLVRWTLISDSEVDGRILMRFTKGTESCSVTVEDDVRGLARRVAVEVAIAPTTTP